MHRIVEISVILLLVAQMYKGALCAISDQGARAKTKATARAGVTLSFPPQEGYADGTVIWAETFDVTLKQTGRANKRVQLKKKRPTYLGALKKRAKEGETFAAYSNKDYELVCRVNSNRQNGPQATRCAGVARVDGLECTLVGNVMFCPPADQGVSGDVDIMLHIPIAERHKRSGVKDPSDLLQDQYKLYNRRKRSVQNLTVEACVTADVPIYNFFANNVDLTGGATAELDAELYIAAVINEVDNFFSKVVSSSLTLSVVLRDVHVSKTDDDNTWSTTSNIVNYNTAFPLLTADAVTHFDDASKCDVIVGLTTKNISDNSQEGSNSVGIAYFTGCCYPNYNVALVEHNFRVSYVMAHEISHLVGGDHDPVGTECYDPAKIMNPYLSNVLDPDRLWYNFSTCNAEDFKNFIDTKSWSGCLTTNTFSAAELDEDRCAGFTGHLLDTPENKCQMLYGVSQLCDYTSEDICNDAIRCKLNTTHCSSLHLSNDGFLCQVGTDKRCYEGYCVPPVQIPCPIAK